MEAVDLHDYRALNDPEARRRIERRRDVFVVEGPLAIAQLLRSPYPVRSVLASEKAAARPGRCWPATTCRSTWSPRTRWSGSPGSRSTAACWPAPPACPRSTPWP